MAGWLVSAVDNLGCQLRQAFYQPTARIEGRQPLMPLDGVEEAQGYAHSMGKIFLLAEIPPVAVTDQIARSHHEYLRR